MRDSGSRVASRCNRERRQAGDGPGEGLRIKGRAHLGIIVKEDEDVAAVTRARVLAARLFTVMDFPAGGPAVNAVGPLGNRFRSVTAGIELLTTVQAAVDEIGGNVH